MPVLWRKADPALLDPLFREAVDDLLSTSPYHWVIDRGFASHAEQAALYAKWVAFREGRGPAAGKAAPPGKSAHNVGMAVDVHLDTDPTTPGLQPSWNTALAGWQWLRAACKTHPVIENGWWFGDWPHLQRRDWPYHAAMRSALT